MMDVKKLRIGDLELSISSDHLKEAGEYFQVMFNPLHNFMESDQNIIHIKELHPDLEKDDWEFYFKIISDRISGTELSISEIPPEKLHSTILIAQIFQNHKFIEEFKNKLTDMMSHEPLKNYLNKCIYYYITFDIINPINGQEKFLGHMEKRLEAFNKSFDSYQEQEALFSVGKDAIDYFKNGSQEDLIVYLKFFRIWWKVAQLQIYEYFGEESIKSDFYQLFTDLIKNLLFNISEYQSLKLLSEEESETIKSRDKVFVKKLFPKEGEHREDQSAILHPSVPKDLKRIEKKWQQLTLGLLDDIDFENMVLAGGSVNKLLDPDIDFFGPQTDIDLFLIGDPETQRNKTRELLTWFLIKYNKDLYIGYKGSVINIWVQGIPRTLQIIAAKSSSISETLFRFDLSHSQMAFDGKHYYMTPQSLMTAQTKVSEQVLTSYKPSLLRLFKTQRQGYSLCVDEPIAQKFEKFKRGELENKTIKQMNEYYKFNYYFPLSTYTEDKNKWELKKHYGCSKIWVGEEIKIPDILEGIIFSSDFRRSYDNPKYSHEIVRFSKNKETASSDKNFKSDNKINKPLFDINEVDLSLNKNSHMVIYKIRYGDYLKPLVWQMPPMTLVYVNSTDYGTLEQNERERTIILEIPEDHLYLNDLQVLDDSLWTKFANTIHNSINNKGRGIDKKDYFGLIKEGTKSDGGSIYYIKLKINQETSLFNSLTGEHLTLPAELDKFKNKGFKIGGKVIVDRMWFSSIHGLTLKPTTLTIYPSANNLKEILFF